MPRYSYRRPHGWIGIIALAIAGLLALAQQQGWLDGAAQKAASSQPGLYTVSRFVDGDTIEINMNGRKEKVRFVGVDTPETHKPNTPVQCYGPAAAAYTKNLVGSHKIRLQSDELSTDRDRYDRLLRYVYLDDGTFINERLVREGYGFYYPYFPFTKSREFEADQNAARSAGKGLWGGCRPAPTEGGGWVSNSQS